LDARLKENVRRRAGIRCEYCRFPERFSEIRFQIDHVIAEQHRGQTEQANLALACVRCNLYKGPNISGLDPMNGELTRLFNPRLDSWADHFEWDGARLVGRTSVGRTTVEVLQMNHEEAIEDRISLLQRGLKFA